VALNTINLTPDPFNVVIIIRLFEKVMRAFTEAVQNLIDRYQIAQFEDVHNRRKA
jgi:hypothetical protein